MLEADLTPNPRDHSRLKATWDALIDSRFLARSPTSVVPLYLSATFVNLQYRPLLTIPLPPNSSLTGVPDTRSDDGGSDATDEDEFFADEAMSHTRSFLSLKDQRPTPLSDATSGFFSGRLEDSDQVWIRSSAPIHLSLVVRSIEGCKEPMWHEYKKLYGGEQTFGDNTLREDFEMYWSNWAK
jgi:hypothetical protein